MPGSKRSDFEPWSVRDRYEAIRTPLDAVVGDLKGHLAEFCRRLRIYAPRIEGRTKDTHSLLLKIFRKEREGRVYSDPLVETSDKVGVRADLVYAGDVDRLVALIRQSTDIFEPITDADVEDKRLTLGSDRVGYLGVHISVVPKELRGLAPALARCEIQIRTNAQAAWAMASHDLVYKPLVPISEMEKRRVNRLTALMELFDEQVDYARDAATNSEQYPLAVIVAALESARFQFLGTEYDIRTTAEIVRALEGNQTAATASELVSRMSAFVAENQSALSTLLRGKYPLLTSQPEAILIYMRLEEDRFAIDSRWTEAGLSRRLLEELADAWGKPLAEAL